MLSCSNSTDSNDEPVSFKLTADNISGPSPLQVNFTAYLSGANIDTIKLFYPPTTLYHGTGKTVIRYAQRDTFVFAKHEYSTKYTYSVPPGVYHAYLVLNGLSGDIVSDTLDISVTQ